MFLSSGFTYQSVFYIYVTVLVFLSNGGAASDITEHATQCKGVICSEGLLTDCLCHDEDHSGSIYYHKLLFHEENGRRPCTADDFTRVINQLEPRHGQLYTVCQQLLSSIKRQVDGTSSHEHKEDDSSSTEVEPMERPIIMHDGSFEQFFLEHIYELEQMRKYRLGFIPASQLHTPSIIGSEAELIMSENNCSSPSEPRVRNKRAGILGSLRKFSDRVITWSLTESLGVPGINEVNEIQLGMVEWERFGNICFRKRPSRGSVSISFNSENHNGHTFSRKKAHTQSRRYIHLNKDRWSWKSSARQITRSSSQAVIKTVVRHQIGHLIGRPDSSSSSVMRASYPYYANPSGLSDSDRVFLLRNYGKCTGTYGAMCDVQFRSSGNVYYRTILTRGSYIWQYSNTQKRPVGEYPVTVNKEFANADASPRAIFQIFYPSHPDYLDKVYYVTGYKVYVYDAGVSGNSYERSFDVTAFGIPRVFVDAAFFDPVSSKIYLFVDSKVYVAGISLTSSKRVRGFVFEGSHSTASIFPMYSGSQPYGQYSAYTGNVDSVYYHILTDEIYITRGNHVWRSYRAKSKSMQYIGTLTHPDNQHLWNYVCNPYSCK